MNLEAVEQASLEYLRTVNRPLVPVNQLLRHLQQERGLADFDEGELLNFLRNHELFSVIDPIGLSADPAGATRLENAGIHAGPSVILSTRIPARSELAKLIDEQMESLCSALRAAMKEASEHGRPDVARQIVELLDRTNSLRERFKGLLEGDQPGSG